MAATPAPQTAAASSSAGAAGRGGIAVLAAKAFFIVIGLVQQTLLPRAIGLAGYGAFSRVMAVANVLNNVVVSSSLQGVSRAVASAPGREPQAFRTALRVHAPLAVVLAVGLALLAPAIAAFQRAPHIQTPLVLVAGVTLLYGLYAPLVGSLNGRKMFGRQAALDMSSAFLRTICIVTLGALWARRGANGVSGAILGAVAGVACVLPIALRWAGTGAAAEPSALPAPPIEGARPLTPGAYLRVLVTLAGAQLFTNLLMQVDITLLGRYLSAGAASTGVSADDATVAADEWVAVYRACQLFAFLPYQLLISITSVLFPMVARAWAENDMASVERFVRRGSRLGALAGGLMVAIIVALPEQALALAYGRTVASRGADVLRVLALAQGAFALFGIATTILTSMGRERLSALVSIVAVALVAVACAVTVPHAEFGGAQLAATARATGLALALALAVAALLVKKGAGAFVPLVTALRVGVAFAITVAVGTRLPMVGPLLTLVFGAGLAVLYVGLLLVSRELGGDDLAALKAVVNRKKK